MSRVLWTPRAERHLEDIAYYIAVHDGRPATAEKIVREIQDKCSLYATNPLLGTVQDELGTTYRSFCHKRWVVIYETLDEGLVVQAVFDATRDYPTLFKHGE
jgi:toxin ParE1/3/4